MTTVSAQQQAKVGSPSAEARPGASLPAAGGPEALTEALFQHARHGIVIHDSGGAIASANPAAERILGLTLAQMQGRVSLDPRWHALREDGSPFPGEEHPAMVSLRTGQPVEDVVMGVFNPHDDSLRWILVSSVAIVPPGETRPAQVVASFIDITERHRAQVELRASQAQVQSLNARLHSVLESPQGVVVFALDRNYRYTTFTRSHQATMQRLWGIEIEPGMNMLEAIRDPLDREKARQNFDRCLAGEHLVRLEEYGAPPQRTHYEDRYSPILGAQGEVLGLTVFAIDITERREAEVALRETTALLLRFLAVLPMGAAVYHGPSGRAVLANDVLQSITGGTAEQLRNQDFRQLASWREGGLLAAAERVLATEGMEELEQFSRTTFGREFWAHATFVGFQMRGEKYLLVLVSDVTARRREENVAREMEAAKALSRISAYLAHEINNPLTGIANSFRILEDAVPAGHPDRRFLAIIHSELDRIAGIVRTAYSIHRPGLPKVKQAYIREIVADLAALLGSKLTAQEVRLDVEDGQLRGRLHEDLLRQVLFNVLMNALAVSPRGGRIRCRCSSEGTDLLLEVEDEGPGIPEALLPSIFEPGFTTKSDPEAGGLGLGLSTCRTLLESVGGAISYRPASPGPGACFRIRLPWQP